MNEIEQKAYSRALRLLGKKAYSKYKLRLKLQEHYDYEVIAEVLQKLDEQSYLREDLYTRSRILGIGRKHYSAYYIQNKLREERIQMSIEEIEAVLEENNITKQSQITALLAKKKRLLKNNLDSNKYKQQIRSFLKTKGHYLDENQLSNC